MHKFLLEMLAHRRQRVIFKNNPNLLTHTQYQYDKKWKEADERADQRKLKIVKHQAEAPTHVLFPSWTDIKTVEQAKEMIRKAEEEKKK